MDARSSTSRPSLAWLLLIALLLPLIAACGSGSPAAPISTGGDVGPGIIAPAAATAAPAAPINVGGVASAPTAAAAEATAAPAAAAAPTAAAAPPSSDTAGSAAPDLAVRPPPVVPQPINDQQLPALKAGEVDDNADFAAYLAYLRSYYGQPTHAVDVTERYILTVLNDKRQPVLDARVRLFDGDKQVFEGRTYAGGKTIILPRALGLNDNQVLRMVVDKGNSSVEAKLQRGQDRTQTVVLPGSAALPQTPKLDVLFLLDSTGSMGDEIGRIQNTIVSIAERIDRITPRPSVRFGLVAYRDRGDEYVTQVHDFTPNVTEFRNTLLGVSAGGGGDTPESLNEGLHDAIERVGWSDNAVRLTFLVADAPPHLDYPQDYDYIQEARVAVAKGIKIYPIAASNSDDQAEYVFRQLAQQTLGRFIFLTYQPGQDAGTPGDTTTHHVDPQSFTVERLDDLVVQVVQRELAQANGSS